MLSVTDSILPVRQLIARVDDELHARAKRRAAATGITLNQLMVRALERELADTEEARAGVRARAAALGLAGAPTRRPRSASAATRDQVIESLRGSGDALARALDWARGG